MDNTLGFNIYYWGIEEQNRLIGECLLPALRNICKGRKVSRVWYDRSNIRGPHLFLLLTTRDSHCPAFCSDLLRELHRYLQLRPSMKHLTETELLLLHDDMHGVTYCDKDLLGGLCANNSVSQFVWFDDEKHFPGRICRSKGRKALFSFAKKMSLLAMRQVSGPDPKACDTFGLQFLMACDEILFDSREEANRYWRFHAGTLIRNIDPERLSPEITTALLARTVSEATLSLSRTWRANLAHSLVRKGRTASKNKMPVMMAVSVVQAFRDALRKIGGDADRIRRELIHVFLRQLGIPVLREIPMVFLMIASSWPEDSR